MSVLCTLLTLKYTHDNGCDSHFFLLIPQARIHFIFEPIQDIRTPIVFDVQRQGRVGVAGPREHNARPIYGQLETRA